MYREIGQVLPDAKACPGRMGDQASQFMEVFPESSSGRHAKNAIGFALDGSKGECPIVRGSFIECRQGSKSLPQKDRRATELPDAIIQDRTYSHSSACIRFRVLMCMVGEYAPCA